ncbi:MAG: hypothetical protein GWN30_02430 [Gammaproteobacteria bacterium]|nr:hypothetical protein [Gammaproteobacteria bacterium]
MENIEKQDKERKPYIAPKIVYEIELETRAGSTPEPPLFLDPELENPFDPDREFDIYRP